MERDVNNLLAPTATTTRTTTRWRATWLVAAAIFLAALFPRTLDLADFATIDETYHWMGRVARFSQALAAGDWASTNQTGHPGVTTMWLGALGRLIGGAQGVTDPGWAGGGVEYLGLLRLPLAVANALAVALGYLLLRRLVRPPTALLGALMWALSPFIIAHSRLLHLDGLLASLMTLSVLLLLAGTRGATSLSAVVGGLALLTKAPSLLLLPTVGLLMHFLPDSARRAEGFKALAARLLWPSASVLRRYALWLAVAALTVLVLWPAMWAGPLDAYGDVLREIRDNGAQPHHSGNFFLGQPVADPGPLFYPAVVLWRTTPLTLLGLLAAALVALADGRAALGRWRQGQPALGEQGRTLLALAGFALLFTLALTLQAKKLDRYLLPAFPALEILAAAGLVRATESGLQPLSRWLGSATIGGLRSALRAACALILAANLVFYHPFYLSAFNPLLGGGATAQQVMLVGLGEGMEEVGAWLRERPDLGRGDVLSWIPPTLAPFVPQEILVRDLRPDTVARASSYAVLYIRSVQHKESAEAEAYVRQSPPLFRLERYGIEYATVHQLPRPFAEPVGAHFGGGLLLRGFSREVVGSTLLITPSWSVERDGPGGAVAFVHVLDEQGRRVAQVDAPVDQGMFARWQTGQQFDPPLPIQLPADLLPGDYRIVLGVYTPPDGERLPLAGVSPAPEALAGPHVLLLATQRLP
ncbi:MAG TPA: glycosyltransferase family 39 protein [Roseiflexaceae bacterium]|nr:glycosyltransferase family 39 protein [Roseiflexaceae bacterium]